MSKASGGDGIPVELFQILKDYAVKVPHPIGQQIWKTQQWPQDWKMSVFILIPNKGDGKEISNHCTFALISHTSKILLKVFQAGLRQYMNQEIKMFKLVVEKAEKLEIKLQNICCIIGKGREFQKNIYFCFIDYAKAVE